MSYMRDKVKLIFLPYLLVFALLLVLMVATKWYFEIANGLMLFDVLKFGVIGGSLLALLLSVIVLDRRLRILRIRGRFGKRNHYFYYFFIILTIIVPVNFALNYVGAAWYSMVHVKTADEIGRHKRLYRYYAIDELQPDVAAPLIGYSHYIDRGHRSSPRNSLEFRCHALLPLTPPYSLYTSKVWLGLYFTERIGNNNSSAVKEQVFNAFAGNCERHIANAIEDIGKPGYYENPPDNSMRRAFMRLLPEEYTIPHQRVAILLPCYNRFDERADFYAGGFVITTTVALFFFFLILAATPVSNKKLTEYLNGK